MTYIDAGPWEVVARLRDFYRDVIGLSVQIEQADESVWFQRADGSRQLGFHVGSPVTGAGSINLCFRVASVDAEIERLCAAGVVLVDQPWDAPWGDRIATFNDPAGHTVWLLGPTQG